MNTQTLQRCRMKNFHYIGNIHVTLLIYCSTAEYIMADDPVTKSLNNDGQRKRINFCYECDEHGHVKSNCPVFQKNRQCGKTRMSSRHVPEEPPISVLLSSGRVAAGINFDQFKDDNVQISKRKNYTKMEKFDEVKELQILLTNIDKSLKWKKPTPVQQHCVPLILKGYDVISCAQTGSGKTGAYLLPLIATIARERNLEANNGGVTKPLALILAPTRELAVQIWHEARILAEGTNVEAYCTYGGTAREVQIDRLSLGNSHVLISTPGRLADFVEAKRINLHSKCKYLVLDEADTILNQGFEDDLYYIVGNMRPKQERQTLMFSATYSKPVQKLAQDFLRKSYVFVRIGVINSANRDICQVVEQIDSQAKTNRLQQILRQDLLDSPVIEDDEVQKRAPEKNPDGLRFCIFRKGQFYAKKTLVFLETRSKTERVAKFLLSKEMPVAYMHRFVDQGKRERILKAFKSGVCPILLATAVAARGLDIVGVDHVINYDMPRNIDEYVHKIGRTGRIGNTGRATSFYDAGRDSGMARYMVKVLSEAQQEVPAFLQELDHYIGNTGIGKNKLEMQNNWD